MHGIKCGSMAHQGLKQHIDLRISRLAICKALRDEIINYCRARRTWTNPNAMQIDAVHVSDGQERQGSKEKDEKPAGKFEGECRYCQKEGHKEAECRKMKADLAAGRCDKSGKPTGVNSLTATGPHAAFFAIELCTE